MIPTLTQAEKIAEILKVDISSLYKEEFLSGILRSYGNGDVGANNER